LEHEKNTCPEKFGFKKKKKKRNSLTYISLNLGHWLITECHCDQGLAFDPLLEVCTWPSSLDDCPNNGPSYFRLKIVGKSDDECIARLFTPF
jgi:hypothetical protein